MTSSYFSIGVFLGIFILSIFLVIQLFWPFITPIILSLVLVSLFYPLYARLLHAIKRPYLAATCTSLVIILCVLVPLGFFIGALSKQALAFYETVGEKNVVDQLIAQFSPSHPIVTHLQAILQRLGFHLSGERMINTLVELSRSMGLLIYTNVAELASNILTMGLHFAVMIIIAFSIFVSGSELKRYLMDLSPLPLDEQERLVNQFSEISRAVFFGNGIVALLEGTFGGLGFFIFDIGPGVFWGVIFMFSSFLPVVGASVVIIPAAVFLALRDTGPMMVVAYLVYNLAFILICEVVIKPRLIGGKSRINAVLVLLSVFGGVYAFGVLGLFYGPLVVTMFMSLVEIYKEHYKAQLLEPKSFI